MAENQAHKRLTRREIVKIIVSLVAVYCLVGAILAAVNQFTAPIIEKNAAAAATESAARNSHGVLVKKLFPEAESFSMAGEWTHHDQLFPIIKVIAGGADAGYVIQTAGQGYSSLISVVVAVDMKGTVKAITVLSQAETPGLGDAVMADDFTRQFIGKDAGHLRVSTSGESDVIQALTAATISSRAVTEDAVKIAVDYLLGAGLVGK